MKPLFKLLILLFVSHSYNGFSQSLKNSLVKDKEVLGLRKRIDSNRYQYIQAHKEQAQRPFIENQTPQIKKKAIKSKRNEDEFTGKGQYKSVLNEIISQYWLIQNEIKKVKSEKNDKRKIDLEKNSLILRKKYISEFEKVNNSETTREQDKLYKLFKKDLYNE